MSYDRYLFGFAKTPIWDVLVPEFAVGMGAGVRTGRNRPSPAAGARARVGTGEGGGGGAGCGGIGNMLHSYVVVRMYSQYWCSISHRHIELPIHGTERVSVSTSLTFSFFSYAY